MFKDYIFIARPDHWFKNIFVVPGIIAAAVLTHKIPQVLPVVLCFISVCLVASANYVINEWLDGEFDKHHPIKSKRPTVLGRVKPMWVFVEYILLSLSGLVLAYFISLPYFITSVALLFMGAVYNVRPIRSKDLPFLDVLTESINNPIRLFMGWFAVTSAPLPPSSLIFAYWMGGAFLMAVKRFSEMRFLGSSQVAAAYRKSFKYYNEGNLLASILFYVMAFAFFFGVFLIKYKIELLLTLPLFFIMFCWYLMLGMDPNSAVKSPEKIYREKKFLLFLILIAVICAALFYLDLPQLEYFLQNNFS